MKETPSQLPIPAFVMNFPFTLDTANPNNIWMQEMAPEELQINKGNSLPTIFRFISICSR